MNNNDVLKKTRVALQLTNDDIVKIMKLVDFKVTASELGAFFRADGHPKYKSCGDQMLRNFLNGLVIYMRGPKDDPNPKPLSFKQKQAKKTKKNTSKKPIATTESGRIPRFKAVGSKIEKKKKQ
ncbi:MAG: DUF1456 family protein [Flavobacteriales bacterium]